MANKFNAPCWCGNGKKYKDCHFGKKTPPQESIHQRNMILLAAATDIFGFSKQKTWADFKKTISGEEVKTFYEVQAALWNPETTDWQAIMPKPDGRLRALYLGDVYPDMIAKNILRFSLYSDELMVIDPFHNPWRLKPQYNPIENPNQFKADTIKLVYFLFRIAPWIRSGIVSLIPDPSDFYSGLRVDSWGMAKARLGSFEVPEEDKAEARERGRENFARTLYAMPDKDILRMIERSGQSNLTERQKAAVLSYARRKVEDDPIALDQPLDEEGQLNAMRGGANLEIALLIAQVTGAFPYTNIHFRWREILSARTDLSPTAQVWSPLTKAFQGLEFQFLDNVDSEFASDLRGDGRLESFRRFLRKTSKSVGEITDLSSIDGFERDFRDELTTEYHKARAEWNGINEDFLKYAGAVATGALATGAFIPQFSGPAIAATGLAGVTQLLLRYMRQMRFRSSNPMSVFIDLAKNN